MNRFLHNPRVVSAVAAVLLMLPVFTAPGVKPGWPRSWEGDEPHYVVMLHSLVNDHDLDVRNNYWQAHKGSLDAGRTMAQSPLLDHQSAWWVGSTRIEWCQVYACDPTKFIRNEDGSVTPQLLPGQVEPQVPEVPSHPAGLPLILAAFLWPLKDTTLIEPGAIVLMGIFMVLGMLLFMRLLRVLGATPLQAAWWGAATFLCTPIWHYSRSIFNEGALLLTLMAATVATLERRHGAWAGLSIGLGILMKPPWALTAIPLWLTTAKRSLKDAAVFAALGTVAVATVLGLHTVIYGGPLRTPQPFLSGNPITGLWGLLMDVHHGLLPHAPIMVLAAWGWRQRISDVNSRLTLYVGLSWTLFMSIWWAWDGGWCFGPRMLVPLMPYFMVGMLAVPLQHRGMRLATGLLLGVGFLFNAVGAFFYHRAYNKHPLEIAWAYLSR